MAAADLAFDLIKEETADHIATLTQVGGDQRHDLAVESVVELCSALEDRNYADAMRLYSDMTSSEEFRNRITIEIADVDSIGSAEEISPDMVDELLIVS